MNRTRLMYLVNSVRKEVSEAFTSALGDWYTIKVAATADHIADRFKDRSVSIKKDIETYRDIMMSLANHYSCYVLTYAVKAKTEGTQEVIVYRRVNGKIFACPITVQMFFNEGEEKPVIAIRLRTVIPEYVSLSNRKTIQVNYVPPKINFEYDGYRRVMSRLDRLIASKDCPPQLWMLKN